MTGRVGRLTCMTVLLTCVAMPPAYAAGELGLSRDGTHWTSSLTEPLFDAAIRWVPGDSRTAFFYVRNQAQSGGDLTVAVKGASAQDFLGDGGLRIAARAGAGGWAEVSRDGDSRRLNASVIPAGEAMKVALNVTFDAAATNQSQGRAIPLMFRVTLAGASARGGRLPGTGSPELTWMAAAGAILVGAGLSLIAARRRNDEEDAHG